MSKPVRLSKKQNTTMNWESTLQKYSPYIMLILMIVLIILIIGLIVTIANMGGGNVTMTESNNYYYHLKDIV